MARFLHQGSSHRHLEALIVGFDCVAVCVGAELDVDVPLLAVSYALDNDRPEGVCSASIQLTHKPSYFDTLEWSLADADGRQHAQRSRAQLSQKRRLA